MIQSGPIASWKAPVWHPDFGGQAEAELILLKKVSEEVLVAFPDMRLELASIEAGYLAVNFFLKAVEWGSLVVVDTVSEMLTLHLEPGAISDDWEELYFPVQAGIQTVLSHPERFFP